MTDYYAVLGVPRDATDEEVKKAFRRLAREVHPDVNPDPRTQERFKEINAAYEVLGDPEKRLAYDNPAEIIVAPANPHEALFDLINPGARTRSFTTAGDLFSALIKQVGDVGPRPSHTRPQEQGPAHAQPQPTAPRESDVAPSLPAKAPTLAEAKQAAQDRVASWRTDAVDTVDRWHSGRRERLNTWEQKRKARIEDWKNNATQASHGWRREAESAAERRWAPEGISRVSTSVYGRLNAEQRAATLINSRQESAAIQLRDRSVIATSTFARNALNQADRLADGQKAEINKHARTQRELIQAANSVEEIEAIVAACEALSETLQDARAADFDELKAKTAESGNAHQAKWDELMSAQEQARTEHTATLSAAPSPEAPQTAVTTSPRDWRTRYQGPDWGSSPASRPPGPFQPPSGRISP